MDSLIQYILDLFSNPDAARAFVSGPGQAMTDAGLVNVAPDEFSSAVANALPGLPLGVGDPIGGLQQVLADQYGYAPGYGGYDPGYGGYDQGYGGYDQGYGYGPGLVGAVAEDAGALVGDAIAPVVDGAGAVLGLGGAIVGDLGGGLVGAVDAGLYGGGFGGGGFGWQPGWGGFGPGTGEFGPGFGPGWGGFRPGWGEPRLVGEGPTTVGATLALVGEGPTTVGVMGDPASGLDVAPIGAGSGMAWVSSARVPGLAVASAAGLVWVARSMPAWGLVLAVASADTQALVSPAPA